MKIIVGIFSAVGLMVQGVFLLLCGAASGMSDAPQQGSGASAMLLLPVIYYGYCLQSSISKSPPSLTAGVIAHAIVIPFCIAAVHYGVGLLALGPVMMATCWFGMYSERKQDRT